MQTPFELQITSSLARWNLLESAFYQAWSAGTLPQEALAVYAREYGAFISTIADGWAAHGDETIAEEERTHVELWREFAKALGTDIGAAEIPAVAGTEEEVKEKVIEAHRVLMGISDENHERFKDLLSALERS